MIAMIGVSKLGFFKSLTIFRVSTLSIVLLLFIIENVKILIKNFGAKEQAG